MRPTYPIVKRLCDVTTAAALLVLLFPLMIGISLVATMSHGRPVLFTQTRPGLEEKLYTIYKFRTMGSAEENSLPSSDGLRLTGLGRRLRRLSLDELPQLWNVIRGDMSLIGPRPLLPEYLPRYNSRQSLRHRVRPGLTGLAQTRGRNLLSWEERLELDAQYVENLSLRTDVGIFFRTLKIIVTGYGVTPDQAELPDEFVPSAKPKPKSASSASALPSVSSESEPSTS